MKTTQLRINQVTLANGCRQTEEMNARMQKLINAHPVISFDWTPLISDLFIAPAEILLQKNKPFIYTTFDYRFGRRKSDVTTTHFKEKISRN